MSYAIAVINDAREIVGYQRIPEEMYRHATHRWDGVHKSFKKLNNNALPIHQRYLQPVQDALQKEEQQRQRRQQMLDRMQQARGKQHPAFSHMKEGKS
jgi:hypothetical protein